MTPFKFIVLQLLFSVGDCTSQVWGQPCSKNDECGLDITDKASFVCIDGSCHCITYKNFVYNRTSHRCEPIDPCSNDQHCQDIDLIDRHRVCRDGRCLCKFSFAGLYENGHKCTFNYYYLFFLIIPGGIFTIIIACLINRSEWYRKINKK